MDLLVFGGTSFVGRAMVSAALSAGHRVTAVNRGSRAMPPGVRVVRADRNDSAALTEALTQVVADAVIDVSGMAARQVRPAAEALSARVGSYLLVSTVSVYPGFPAEPVAPDSPTVQADPLDDALPALSQYGAQKRAAELAVLQAMGDSRTVILRPGFILGPHENVGRVDYWCRRSASGAPYIVGGEADRPFQVVDARDLAQWSVDAVSRGVGGVFTASAPFGRDTWGDWVAQLEVQATSDPGIARPGTPTWVSDEALMAAAVAPGSGLPLWIPGGAAPIDTGDIEAAGFRARPLAQTVADSWTWWRSTATKENVTAGERPGPLSVDREREILQDLAASLRQETP